jgi:hypothetical protein
MYGDISAKVAQVSAHLRAVCELRLGRQLGQLGQLGSEVTKFLLSANPLSLFPPLVTSSARSGGCGELQELRCPQTADYFARLIQRVVPKSYPQALAEVTICRIFMENFSGDQASPLPALLTPLALLGTGYLVNTR